MKNQLICVAFLLTCTDAQCFVLSDSGIACALLPAFNFWGFLFSATVCAVEQTPNIKTTVAVIAAAS